MPTVERCGRSMNPFVFRSATRDDVEAVAALHTESWRHAYRGILPDAYLDGPIVQERLSLWQVRFSSPNSHRHLVLLAESGKKLVGFACVLLDEEPPWGACLDNLHVLPNWRGMGLGRQLFGRVAQWVLLMEPGWGMHLWVFEANSGARRLYDRLGGAVVELHSKRITEGVEAPSLRYFWPDLQVLVDKL
jgi:GNAT superfamily N-acetyltransferase